MNFLFFDGIYSQTEQIETRLGKEKAYEFLKIVLEFGIYGEKPDAQSEYWLYGLEPIFKSIELSKERYKNATENGKKGGRPTTSFNIYEAAQMRKSGQTYSKIANHFGVSTNTIRKYVDKPKTFEETLARLQKLSNFLPFPSDIKELLEKESFLDEEKTKLLEFFQSID